MECGNILALYDKLILTYILFENVQESRPHDQEIANI